MKNISNPIKVLEVRDSRVTMEAMGSVFTYARDEKGQFRKIAESNSTQIFDPGSCLPKFLYEKLRRRAEAILPKEEKRQNQPCLFEEGRNERWHRKNKPFIGSSNRQT